LSQVRSPFTGGTVVSADRKSLLTMALLVSVIIIYRVEPCTAWLMALALLVLAYALFKRSQQP